MRKHRVVFTIAIAVIIAVCGVFIFDCVYYYSQALADDFDLDDYAGLTDEFKEYIAYDPLPTQIGPVADKKAAKQKAEAYWLEHCVEDVKEQKPSLTRTPKRGTSQPKRLFATFGKEDGWAAARHIS